MALKNYKIKRLYISDFVDKKIINKLKKVIEKKRFIHSLNVAKTSVFLAKKFKVNVKKAALAGLLHDCTKTLPADKAKRYINNLSVDDLTKETPSIWHAWTGYLYAKKIFGIKNKEILNAIKFHTVGSEKMTKLAKIVYIADFIAERKKYILSKNISLNKLLLSVIKEKLYYLLKNNKKIHTNVIKIYNKII